MKARASLPRFFGQKRLGISELYATVLMIGATLSLGGYITMAAVGQMGLTSSSAAAAAGVQEGTSGKLASFVYSAVGTPGACPAYQGAPEGTVLTVGVFDYGSNPFLPQVISVNGTVYAGPFSSAAPGVLTAYQLSLSAGSCAHWSGQTVLMADGTGDELQFET